MTFLLNTNELISLEKLIKKSLDSIINDSVKQSLLHIEWKYPNTKSNLNITSSIYAYIYGGIQIVTFNSFKFKDKTIIFLNIKLNELYDNYKSDELTLAEAFKSCLLRFINYYDIEIYWDDPRIFKDKNKIIELNKELRVS